MKTAFACWDERIAPVFDTARQVLVVEDEAGRIVGRQVAALPDGLPVQRALALVEMGIGSLVCGAISRPLQQLVSAYGVRVVPFVAGALDEVVGAWQDGRLDQDAFAMPGVCGPGRRRRRMAAQRGGEDGPMNGQGRGGQGRGAGRG
ncbi:MAG: NifB/NifX family molybdenum-iron cluster-binding protein, partial [Krumholzibacteria bacterium]|nr:NifB/NifX family molybdenum-iron cluster-binding protein [Candidatus Krumholzibacteria bacterium]